MQYLIYERLILRKKNAEEGQISPQNPKTQEEVIQVLATEMAEEFISGMERASINSPFAGYTYDPQTDTLFILEADGRLTAWNLSGTLLWTHSFRESGCFISLVESLIVISFRSGNTFWISQDGAIRYFAKTPPAQAVSVTPIPGSERYLMICDNGRRYELDRHTGEVTEGPEGNRNMRLFQYQNQLFFYDGYLWATPSGQEWRTFEIKPVENATSISDLSIDSSSPQIKADKPFEELWCYSNPDEKRFDFFALDKENKRICIGKPKSSLTAQEKKQEEASRENAFAYWHEIICYDYALNQIWSKAYLSELTCLAVSPEGDAIFIGLWHNGLAYDPAELIVLNSKGKEYARFTTPPANPISIVFEAPESGVFTDFNGAQNVLKRLKPGGEWIPLDTIEVDDVHQEKEYGAGIDQITRGGSFSLKRTGKKSYQVTSQQTVFDLKVSAAIYEAITVPGSDNLLLRVGNKSIRVISPTGEAIWELKTKNNIKGIVPDGKGYLLLGKDDIIYVSEDGNLLWRAGCPPNTISNKALWSPGHNAYLWYAGGDSYNFQVTLVTPQGGDVKRSQIFEGVPVKYDQEIDVADDSFVVPIGRAKICCFKI
ncbi:hypothetical protein [Methanoculleus chikugoensis]|uniref:hypothetical protein n=1 Tax=Methanoculleus chikugoensis TaxID=118126 RepID=UPI001FB513C0|nr:hypothetical protein [Methanoculleus chikugoensis]